MEYLRQGVGYLGQLLDNNHLITYKSSGVWDRVRVTVMVRDGDRVSDSDRARNEVGLMIWMGFKDRDRIMVRVRDRDRFSVRDMVRVSVLICGRVSARDRVRGMIRVRKRVSVV